MGDAAGDELGLNKSLPHVPVLWPGGWGPSEKRLKLLRLTLQEIIQKQAYTSMLLLDLVPKQERHVGRRPVMVDRNLNWKTIVSANT